MCVSVCRKNFLFGSLTSTVRAVCTVHDSAKMKT